MKLKAKKHFRFQGAFLEPEQEFEADAKWGNILTRIGNADPIGEVQVEKSLKAAKGPNKKGGYNRRDMTKTETK